MLALADTPARDAAPAALGARLCIEFILVDEGQRSAVFVE